MPVSVNGTAGFGSYQMVGRAWEPWAIQVIEVAGGKIVGHHNFLYPERFADFGLPDHLGSGERSPDALPPPPET